MTPYYQDDWLRVYVGDCRAVLATLPAESVHCVVTSPPYWGLRDYGTAGQLGLEPTPEDYVANMVAVFREVRRVLRDDGTLWLNLGDSYATSPAGVTTDDPFRTSTLGGGKANSRVANASSRAVPRQTGLKPKDLVGIPWRVAFALQADGWYLRSDIIWSKLNPMPESVTDRPTKSHEYVFLLSKSPRYRFDADAVREESSPTSRPQGPDGGPRQKTVERHEGIPRDRRDGKGLDSVPYMSGRNIRSVWTIATQPYPGAHFATFPPKLVEPCILAGTSERGVCPDCGAPWERIVERGELIGKDRGGNYRGREVEVVAAKPKGARLAMNPGTPGMAYENITTGWRPTCAHTGDPVPATVMDIFGGSGTTAMVAQHLNRRAVLIELNPDYIDQALRRNAAVPMGLTA